MSQRRELAEMVLGVETRNRYAICAAGGQPVAYAAEQGKGLLDVLARSFLRHWRSFDIDLFTADRRLAARATHPFRWFSFNECLEVTDADGTRLGSIQRRFAFFSRRLDVLGPRGELLLSVDSGFFRVWTFEFKRGEHVQAVVEKRWSGLMKEMFTDADNFRVRINDQGLPDATRWLLIAAAVFVDMQFFEKEGGRGM